MIKRRGGGLPVGDGRVGVPLDGDPTSAWVAALRDALAEQRPDDDVWQHAVANVSADKVNDVPHLMFLTSGHGDANFLVMYVRPIDVAIEAANLKAP